MLNKLKFNNLVISNKKGIQQSRIQTINKLVHKIRKLKTLLEKHPDNTKCKQRIRKSIETMEILKKLKRIDVMKKVLIMNKPAPAVITNGIATPEEVAVALLSMNKTMQGLMKRFKTELELNDDERNEWQQVLVETSKRKLKIERTEEKRRKRVELKQQKIMGRKRQEWLEENQKFVDKSSISSDCDMNVSTTGSWKIEELSNDNITRENIVTNEKSARPTNEKPTIRETSPSSKKLKTPNRKESRSTRNVLNTIEENVKISKVDRNEISKESEDATESLVVDPFFITDSGENYLSTAVNKNYISEGANDEEKRNLHMIKLNNYDKKPNEFRDRRHDYRDKNQKYIPSKGEQRVNSKGEQQNKKTSKYGHAKDNFLQNKVNRKNNLVRQDSQPKGPPIDDEKNLHPSWAAKQKLKTTITEFRGKKIKFEDDEYGKPNTHEIKETASNVSIEPKPNQHNRDSLHPSWAAKQKLKPSITTFQGKKITFDVDE